MTQAALSPASTLGRLSWAMFDWANQPFFTVVTTFIFVPYFVTEVVGDAVRGQAIWAYGLAFAGMTVALLSPFLGAMADAGGPRKPFIGLFQAIAVAGCIALWWVEPGRPYALGLGLAALIVATVGAEFSIVFNNALLPGLTTPDRLGRLSGLGWGMGYLGGLIALFLVLVVSRPEFIGIAPPPGQALFGLDRASFGAERVLGPASAVWLAIFVLPMFLFTPDAAHRGLGRIAAAVQGTRQLLATVRGLGRQRNLLFFLIAFMIYNDGLAQIISFGGIYAAGTFGWTSTDRGIFGIVLVTIAIFSAFVGGQLDDRLGSKRTVQLAIVAVAIATIGIMSITETRILFVIDVAARPAGAALFSSPQEQIFLLFGLMIGMGMGPMQAASRTLVGRLAPPGKVGECYGLFALSGRATAFFAPFLIGVSTQASGSLRASLVVILAMLCLGFLLLAPVKEPAAV